MSEAPKRVWLNIRPGPGLSREHVRRDLDPRSVAPYNLRTRLEGREVTVHVVMP